MDNTQFLLLVAKYFASTITPEEKSLLQKTISEEKYYRDKFSLLLDYFVYHNELAVNDFSGEFQAVFEKINTAPAPVMRLNKRYKIAAAVIFIVLMMGVGWVYILRTKSAKQIAAITLPGNCDVAPGKDKAMLKLPNGSYIDLDSLQNNASLHGFQKHNGNEIVLNSGKAKGSALNTLSTPQGGKYKLTLADGSMVWLNAESSLQFPMAFDGEKREVALTGEAYFEIKENKKQPFVVKVKDMTVQVLGTHFNVMAYNNEKTINTTLLKGAVKVSKGNISTYLKPGQQSSVTIDDKIRVSTADLEETMAWKNDLFVFKSCGFDEMMRQLARWYDVIIEYKSDIPEGKYSGIIGRNNNLSVVLKMLETSGVLFRIEDKKIIIE